MSISPADLADYEELFEEKATLFAELLKGGFRRPRRSGECRVCS